jgi:NAD kinase
MKYKKIIDKYDKNKYIQEQDNYIIAQGGDGTLLKAIKLFKNKNKPFFGIAAGTKNFLMNSETKIDKNAKYKTFNLIKIKIWYKKDGKRKQKTVQGFNDIAIGGEDSLAAWIHFDVKEKDKFMGKFYGGGLIISTPQGSTAVNKNNHGVVLPLSSKSWSITGDKTEKKINYVIKPHTIKIKLKSRNKIIVWVDGTNHIIQDVYKVKITEGDKVKVIFNNYKKFKKKRRK